MVATLRHPKEHMHRRTRAIRLATFLGDLGYDNVAIEAMSEADWANAARQCAFKNPPSERTIGMVIGLHTPVNLSRL